MQCNSGPRMEDCFVTAPHLSMSNAQGTVGMLSYTDGGKGAGNGATEDNRRASRECPLEQNCRDSQFNLDLPGQWSGAP